MKNIKIIYTSPGQNLFWDESTASSVKKPEEMQLAVIYPEETGNEVKGFGGAFTEAAAHTYASMSEDVRERIIEDLYGDSGLRYTMGRIHMNSCDFALGNYTYIEEGDTELKTFNIEHDEKEIIPMIRDASKKLGRQPVLMMTPWSPPPFMKTNKEMNHGGKLKEEYASLWAEYFVKFINEYKKRGISISYTTVQNEPMAVQTWDSCIYTNEEEADFVKNHLGPTLKKEGLLDEIKIFVWDHNKEKAYDRMRDILSYKENEEYVSGCAVHWYSGDHFDALSLIKKKYPDKEIFFTEGCVEYYKHARTSEEAKAEMYAHQMLGNLKNGCSAIIDWNLILDYMGGPNHVENFCDAPLMSIKDKDAYERKLSYYYIGHFSRYIKSGAKQIVATSYTDKLETLGYINPDGERVIIILNQSDDKIPVKVKENEEHVSTMMAPHSIKTITYRI
ncbi:MAG: glucosylceramidase [Lachnospiraceae bacterium]|nr:glucosylceramidase [Lachnospiraceae bacterium]